MTTHTHCCSATGCGKQIPLNMLMCMTHWRMVPAPLQRKVLDTWRVRQRRGPGDRTSAEQHEQAKAEAITAVHSKLHRRIADRQAQTPSLF